MNLIVETWEGERAVQNVTQDPSLEQAMDAVKQLDGVTCAMVSLFYNDACYLLIGGPHDGRYLVNGTLDNASFFSPKNATVPIGEVSCLIGGQRGDYRNEQFIDWEVMEDAVRHFYKEQDFTPGVSWFSKNGRGPKLERS